MAALLYEVVWTRLLGLVFGHTVYAITTVLAAYMGGLALGAWFAGRRGDRLARPLRAYALLEAGIGLLGAATPLLFRLTEAAYAPLSRAWQPGPLGAGLLHFALAALVLLPPTALMGATLPILARVVVERAGDLGPRVGTLYALNTWGAVAGTALTGFLLLPAIGLRLTVGLGVAVNLAVAAAALWLERGAPSISPAPGAGDDRAGSRGVAEVAGGAGGASEGTGLSPLQIRTALAAIALSGAASMAYQVGWTRALGLTLGSSTYAFTAMLTTFLAGLALGALLVSRALRARPVTLGAFGLLELGIALLALALLPALGAIPDALLWILQRTGVSHGSVVAAQFALSFLALVLPTLAIGATFPVVVALLGGALDRVGRDVGVVYGWNTLGTIAGSMVAGFVLVPAIGIQGTVRAAAAVNAVAGLAVLAVAAGPAARVQRLAGVAVAIAAVLTGALAPRWDVAWMTSGVAVYANAMARDPEGVRRAQSRREILFYAEGLSTTVAVIRSPTQLSLSVNGKTDAGTGRDMQTQLLLGHLGPLFLEHPRRALVVGLASGMTAGAVAQHPFERIDVAEIEPAMEQASAFFARENRDVLADRRVRVLAGDGRQLLEAASEPYDLVVSEPSNPWIAGVANLFTRDFYARARSRLAPGGVFVQWLQGYSIFPEDLRMVIRTFRSVFPHATLWAGSPGDFLLVATPGEACLDPALVDGRLAAGAGAREDFARFGWDGGRLAFRLRLGEEDLARFAGEGTLNTDDLPLLEFSAPRALYAVSGSDENEALVRAARRAERPCVRGLPPEALIAPVARLRAAEAFLDEGRPADAEREVAGMGPPERLAPEVRAARARVVFELGQFEASYLELEAVKVAAPGDPIVRELLPAVELLGAPAVVARAAQTLQATGGGWYAEPGRLGELLFELAGAVRRDEPARVALGLLRRGVALQPGKGRLRASLGIALARAGRVEEALAQLDEAVRLEPAWAAPRELAAQLRGLSPTP
ncbi:MAG: fused MFS/spermidine synthase [Anaeromyxobacter sp.]